MDVPVAVLVNPFTAKFTTTLGPSAVAFLLANMANLVGLLSFLTVDALVTAFFHQSVVEIFEFFFADFALNAILAKVPVPMKGVFLHFKFSTDLMKHVATLHARNSFIAQRLKTQVTRLTRITSPQIGNSLKIQFNALADSFGRTLFVAIIFAKATFGMLKFMNRIKALNASIEI